MTSIWVIPLSVGLFVGLVPLVKGCKIKQFNDGSPTEQFHFVATIYNDSFYTYGIVLYQNTAKIAASFYKGILEAVSITPDVILTGNISAGDFSFSLTNVSLAKVGVYNFTGPDGNTDDAELGCISLYLLGKPKTPILSMSSIPEVGNPIIFTCLSESTTFPNDHGLSLVYNWFVNSEKNPAGDRFAYVANRLTISDIQETDKETPVYCSVTEMANGGFTSNTSNQLRIHVFYGPENVFLNPNANIHTVNEGEHLNDILCHANCYPNCSYVWQRKNVAGNITNNILRLGNNITRDVAGEYICTAINYARSGAPYAIVTVKILVRYPPDVSVTTETVDFFRGNNITLKCLARGEPEQYTFDKWLHVAPDNYTEIETLVGKQNKGENILVLKNVTYMDSGIYVCRVTNNITIGTIKFGKADKQISVKDKPYVLLTHREFGANLRANLSLIARFYSNDPGELNVTWFKSANGTASTTINGTEKYSLSINREPVIIPFYTKNVSQLGYRFQLDIINITDEDFTYYKIAIRNTLGSVSVELFAYRIGPPLVPQKFEVLPGSQTTSSITLTWYPGFHGGFDQIFHISSKRAGRTWEEGASIFGGIDLFKQFRITLQNLSPGSSYSFRIYASNKYGRSSMTVVMGNTKLVEEDAKECTNFFGPGVGTGIGIATVIIAVVVAVVYLKRRRSKNPDKEKISGATDSHEKAKSEPMQYETLSHQKEQTAPYESLTDENSPNLLRSAENAYDDLDTNAKSHTVCLNIAGETTSPTAIYRNLKVT